MTTTRAFDEGDRVSVHNYDDTKNQVDFGTEPLIRVDGLEGTVLGAYVIDGVETIHYKVKLDQDAYGLGLPFWLFTAAELKYIPPEA